MYERLVLRLSWEWSSAAASVAAAADAAAVEQQHFAVTWPERLAIRHLRLLQTRRRCRRHA